jgi:hypothetical protein
MISPFKPPRGLGHVVNVLRRNSISTLASERISPCSSAIVLARLFRFPRIASATSRRCRARTPSGSLRLSCCACSAAEAAVSTSTPVSLGHFPDQLSARRIGSCDSLGSAHKFTINIPLIVLHGCPFQNTSCTPSTMSSLSQAPRYPVVRPWTRSFVPGATFHYGVTCPHPCGRGDFFLIPPIPAASAC